MEALKPLLDWVWMIVTAMGGYLMYHHKRNNTRLDRLEDKVHQLDKSQVELIVELREVKQDIRELKHSIDRLIERL